MGYLLERCAARGYGTRFFAENAVDETVIDRFLRRHVVIAFDVAQNVVDRFLRVLLVDARKRTTSRDQVSCMDFYVGRLTTHLRDPGLVDQDFRILQGDALSGRITCIVS